MHRGGDTLRHDPVLGVGHRALDAHVKLLRAAQSVRAAVEESLDLTGAGPSESQFGVLEALHHLGPMSQRTLGAKLFTSNPNVTAIADALEKRGLVRRARSEQDRRNVIVELTPEGRKLIQKIFPPHVARLVEVYSALTAAEQDELGRLAKKLGLAVSSRPPS